MNKYLLSIIKRTHNEFLNFITDQSLQEVNKHFFPHFIMKKVEDAHLV